MGVEEERGRRGGLREELERPADPTGLPAGAAGLDLVVGHDERIVELTLGERESLASTDRFATPFELVERDVHALTGERPERALDALARDERPKVARLTAGIPQQAGIRTRRACLDRAIRDGEEPLLARRQVAPQLVSRRPERDRRSQEVRHVTREAPQHAGVADRSMHSLPQTSHASAGSQHGSHPKPRVRPCARHLSR